MKHARRKVTALTMTFLMIFAMSSHLSAVGLSYYDGQVLSYDEITSAPSYLKDGNFSNGEIFAGRVVNEEPQWVEMTFAPQSNLARASRTEAFMFLDSTSGLVASGLNTLDNHIGFSVGPMTVYHRLEGSTRPTTSYNSVRYMIQLTKGILDTTVNEYSHTLGGTMYGTFWNLNTSTTYKLRVYLIDSLPSQYIAEGSMTITNVAS